MFKSECLKNIMAKIVCFGLKNLKMLTFAEIIIVNEIFDYQFDFNFFNLIFIFSKY
jgi:hypothetical protein